MAYTTWRPTKEDPLPQHLEEWLDFAAQEDAGLEFAKDPAGKEKVLVRVTEKPEDNVGIESFPKKDQDDFKAGLRRIYNQLKYAYLREAQTDIELKLAIVDLLPSKHQNRALTYVAAYAESLDPRRSRMFTKQHYDWLRKEHAAFEMEVQKMFKQSGKISLARNAEYQRLREIYLNARAASQDIRRRAENTKWENGRQITQAAYALRQGVTL